MSVYDLRRLVYHCPKMSNIRVARLAEKDKKRVQEELLDTLEGMGLVWVFPAQDIPYKYKRKIQDYRIRIGNRAYFVLPRVQPVKKQPPELPQEARKKTG